MGIWSRYNRAYARFQMGLVELAQRELSLPEMNFFLTGETDSYDILTSQSTFTRAFRECSLNTPENPYLNDTLSLIRDMEKLFLNKIAAQRSGSVIVIEPNKITAGIRNDVNAGEYEIAIKANVPVSW